MRRLLTASIAFVAPAAFAQLVPVSFPDDAVPAVPAEFAGNAVGKTYVGKLHDGREWTMQFDDKGRFSWSNGTTPDSGNYRFEGTKICTDTQINGTCNEFRVRGNQIFYKRVRNNEVVTLTER